MKINWREILKWYLQRRVTTGIGLGLIGLGLSVVTADALWELALDKIFSIVFQQQPDQRLTVFRMIVSAILIVMGLAVLASILVVERAAKYAVFQFLEYHLVIGKYNQNISHEEWEDMKDPTYEFQINFKVSAGSKSLQIASVNIERFVNGKPCIASKLVLKESVPGSDGHGEANAQGIEPKYHEPYSNWIDFADIKVDSGTTKEFLYMRKAQGPNIESFGHEITYGKGIYFIKVGYHFENEKDKIEVEYYCKELLTNKLEKVDRI